MAALTRTKTRGFDSLLFKRFAKTTKFETIAELFDSVKKTAVFFHHVRFPVFPPTL